MTAPKTWEDELKNAGLTNTAAAAPEPLRTEATPEEQGRPLCPACQRPTLDIKDDGSAWCAECSYYRRSDIKTVNDLLNAVLAEAAADAPKEGLQTRSLDTVEAKAINWLWKGLIPRAALTIIVGDGGVGKSQTTLDWASRITRGAAWPDGQEGSGTPANVLLLSAEDPAAEVLVPRLRAAGADLKRIIQIQHVVGKDGHASHVNLERDLAEIEKLMKDTKPSLIVIDPLNAYMGKAETFKDNHVRTILGPLAALAEKYDVAILAVMHLNKSSEKSAMSRVMGSVAFGAAARSVLMVTPDPENQRVLLTHAKSNLAKKATGMAFTVEAVDLGNGIETSRVQWQEGVVISMSADDAARLSDPQHQEEQKRNSERDRIVEWLTFVLSAGPMLSSELLAKAKDEGYAARTLRRARQDLGVVTSHDPKTGAWICSLPAEFSIGTSK